MKKSTNVRDWDSQADAVTDRTSVGVVLTQVNGGAKTASRNSRASHE